jgi:excisionase family DNA binding protein
MCSRSISPFADKVNVETTCSITDVYRKSKRKRGIAMQDKLLLKVGEAATLLGVAKITIYRLVWAGAIKPVHIGRAIRIPRSELERFVRELQEVGAIETQP